MGNSVPFVPPANFARLSPIPCVATIRASFALERARRGAAPPQARRPR